MKFFPATLALCAAIWTSCKAPAPTYHVQHRGALSTIMHEGDLRAVIALDSLKHLPNLYALGAMENLKGEILIYDGEAIVASVQDNTVHVTRDFEHKAALLVYAQVARWREIKIPEGVQSMKALESFIAQSAKQRGLKQDAPFPFLLRGAINVDWHVVDWAEGDAVHTHAKHKASGLHGKLEQQPVEILGFYSEQHRGIFTHRDSNAHLHVKTVAGGLAAHVDGLKLNGEASLLLPE
jgi:acetolactate decarboxylase